MRNGKKICNLGTLEREISRLQEETKKKEEKFEDNLEYLRENYSSLFTNSFFRKRKSCETKGAGLFDSLFSHKEFNGAISGIAEKITDKASERISKFVGGLFAKKN